MGFSLTAAFAIISVSLFVAIEIFSSQFLPMIDDFENSNSELMERYSNRIETNMNLTEVNVTSNLTNYDYNITINNTGDIVLNTNEINILVNGNFEEFQCNDDYILPLTQSNLILSNLSYSGIVRIKAITGNGIEEYKEITI
jgi:archaellum component FlaF (FlaF/FlaG flagellin family)